MENRITKYPLAGILCPEWRHPCLHTYKLAKQVFPPHTYKLAKNRFSKLFLQCRHVEAGMPPLRVAKQVFEIISPM